MLINVYLFLYWLKGFLILPHWWNPFEDHIFRKHSSLKKKKNWKRLLKNGIEAVILYIEVPWVHNTTILAPPGSPEGFGNLKNCQSIYFYSIIADILHDGVARMNQKRSKSYFHLVLVQFSHVYGDSGGVGLGNWVSGCFTSLHKAASLPAKPYYIKQTFDRVPFIPVLSLHMAACSEISEALFQIWKWTYIQ